MLWLSGAAQLVWEVGAAQDDMAPAILTEALVPYDPRAQPWKTSTKANASNIYGCFAKLNGLDWSPPIYKPNYEMPFIPCESEIDQLIAASGKKLSALL
jgi:hypothetical protein